MFGQHHAYKTIREIKSKFMAKTASYLQERV